MSVNANNHILNQVNIQYFLNNISINNNLNDLNILYLNIRSIRNKLDDLESIIQQHYKTLTHIIALTEVWIFDNEVEHFNIPNYDKYYCNRSNRGGGCALYVHNTLYSNIIVSKEWNGNTILGIHINNHKFKLNLFNIYKPPHTDFSEFMSIFSPILSMYKHSFIIGDFNFNLLEKNTDVNVGEYIDMVCSMGYLILNKEEPDFYTRSCNNVTKTILDHVITDLLNYSYRFALFDTYISDHRYIYFSICNIININNYDTFKTVIEYNKINTIDLNAINQSVNINEFINTIKNTLATYTKKIKIKNKIKNRKPWINENILNLIKTRNQFFKLKIKYPLNEYFFQQFILYRNKVIYLNRELKKNYFSLKFENNLNDPKKFWSITNEILFNGGKTFQSDINIEVNNLLITNPQEVANHFNNFFINRATVRNTNIQMINSTPHNPFNSSFYLRKINNSDLLHILRTLNTSAANGYDNIPMKFFNNFTYRLCDKLTEFINTSIDTGIFPDCLKIAKVTPIYKSKNKLEMNNYRPISVLPSLSKIFEKAIQIQLEKYLYENSIINPNQFGFVTNSSTLAACTQLVNFIENGIDRNVFVSCIFLDLEKAFDSVQHDILHQKFQNIGISHKALHLLKSYHNNRKQFVKIGDQIGTEHNIAIGVAQGSILSTTEFAIFINDIFKLSLLGEMQLYADDIVLMYTNKNVVDLKSNMESDLIQVNQWLKKNQLKLNVGKSNFIIFDRNRTVDNFESIQVNHSEINRIYQTKYLGLYLDSKLNWHAHINNIKNKIRPIMFATRRLRYCLHKDALLNIYHAHIASRLIYLNPVWSGASVTKINELSILQNKCLRVVFGYGRYQSRVDLYTGNIFPLNKLITYHLLLLIYSLKNNLLKHNFEITYRFNIHNYNTRRQSHINIPSSRTNVGQRGILNRGFEMFNNLPREIKYSLSISLFKSKIKDLLTNT